MVERGKSITCHLFVYLVLVINFQVSAQEQVKDPIQFFDSMGFLKTVEYLKWLRFEPPQFLAEEGDTTVKFCMFVFRDLRSQRDMDGWIVFDLFTGELANINMVHENGRFFTRYYLGEVVPWLIKESGAFNMEWFLKNNKPTQLRIEK